MNKDSTHSLVKNMWNGAFSGITVGFTLQPLDVIKSNIIVNPNHNSQISSSSLLKYFPQSVKSLLYPKKSTLMKGSKVSGAVPPPCVPSWPSVPPSTMQRSRKLCSNWSLSPVIYRPFWLLFTPEPFPPPSPTLSNSSAPASKS